MITGSQIYKIYIQRNCVGRKVKTKSCFTKHNLMISPKNIDEFQIYINQ